MTKQSFAAIGECMIELSHQGPTSLSMGFAGDTFNVAAYVSRATAGHDVETHYVTALGDDPYSAMMLKRFEDEEIHTQYIARLPNKMPGLYMIQLDDKGERSFYYYRGQSAARDLFKQSIISLDPLAQFNMLYFSGITLAILDDASRDALFNLLQSAKNKGARIAFDTNYRPRQWESADAAKAVFNRFLTLVDIFLPTFDDEKMLYGDNDAHETFSRYKKLGIAEIVVKDGAKGCLCEVGDETIWVPTTPKTPVDTTSAGDSFNAGYLSGRLAGKAIDESAMLGHTLAGEVIMHKGAIIPKNNMPKLLEV